MSKWAIVRVRSAPDPSCTDEVSAVHSQAQCMVCRAWMTTSICEHAYTALACEGIMSLEQVKAPERSTRRLRSKRPCAEFEPRVKPYKKQFVVPENTSAAEQDQEAAPAQPASLWKGFRRLSPAERVRIIRCVYGQ